ncbi:pyridoxal phosphate-dependent aminotransferase [Desulforegula conservatrix]|uniref:pyridoxal phosphate-dependent aminotransferase n=1 Tax=Desulforegula conservatrix TaxID=153026 RepID=UPI00040E3DDE|nr:aminotransferase class I/II-fold pyridoxal phosphate-dependent enzyme [Desulforegula conservatrix]
MITGHGGDIQETAARLGCAVTELVDMSSNLNPIGPLPGLEEFLCKNIRSIITLPDADTDRVSSSLARLYDLSAENISAGNGTTQFIYNLPLALKFKKVLILGPVYADYADACAMHGAETTLFMADNDKGFEWDYKKLDHELKIRDAVYICNPNSPTGKLTDAAEIAKLAAQNPDKWVIVDETYLPFLKNWKKQSLLYSDLKNLIVFHSMSKIHRLPGLRIGFMKADKDVVSKFMDFFMPWSINSLAQSAVFHLAERKTDVEKFIKDSANYAYEQKQIIMDGLKGTGIDFFASSSVFMLGKTGPGLPDSATLHNMMLEKKIMIRDCSNFKGLSGRHFRISLHTQENNLNFVKAIRECIGPK